MDLQKFCDNDSLRNLDHPFLWNGFIYASNGHIAVRVPDDPTIQCGDESIFAQRLEELFEQTFASCAEEGFKDFSIILPPLGKCGACGGKGKLAPCPECDGEGSFRHGSHTYECEECDGTGRVEGDIVACETCDGTGDGYDEPVIYESTGFNHRYLEWLLELPGIQLCIGDNPGSVAAFRFNGGSGVLMPMHTSGGGK